MAPLRITLITPPERNGACFRDFDSQAVPRLSVRPYSSCPNGVWDPISFGPGRPRQRPSQLESTGRLDGTSTETQRVKREGGFHMPPTGESKNSCLLRQHLIACLLKAEWKRLGSLGTRQDASGPGMMHLWLVRVGASDLTRYFRR